MIRYVASSLEGGSLIFEMQVYIPLCDVWREENAISTVVTKPSVTFGETVIPAPLTGCPFGSNQVT